MNKRITIGIFKKMGLSSSQARLLHLTSRMHQIEYKAAKLEAEKLQMANESSRVYEDYLFALDKTKIQSKILTTDGSITYVDATYNSLVAAGYTIKLEGEDKEIVNATTDANYKTANGNKEYFKALQTGRVTNADRTVGGYIEIYSLDQLKQVNNNGSYRLMCDIDASGQNLQLNLNGGNFDGNGHSITNLENTLFNSISGSTVKNLSVSGNISNSTSTAILAKEITSGSNISDISISGSINYLGSDNYVGALAGVISNTNVSNCVSTANINAQNSENVGGLLGSASNGTVTDCSVNNITVTGKAYVGGLLGNANTTVKNSQASNSTITATGGTGIHRDSFAGGFIGRIAGTVENCQSINNYVYANERVIGGFAGAGYGTIKNCTSSSNVTVEWKPGSVGEDFTAHSAEFIGMVGGGSIENCSSSGIVEIKNKDGATYSLDYFVGSTNGMHTNTDIKNCYNGKNDASDFIASSMDLTLSNSPATTDPTTTITVTPPTIKTTTIVDDSGAEAAGELFDRMKAGYSVMAGDDPRITHGDDTQWLTNMILAGLAFIYKTDAKTSELYQVSVATDTSLQEVSDESLLKKAEAKYEADMKKIDRKDRQYDTELAKLENERNAISQEMETLKTVAKENVDRTFKLFS